MKNSEMKELFLQADRQTRIKEAKKQKVLLLMAEEMEKQRTPIINQREILFSQFLHVDKLFLSIYAVVVCLIVGVLFLLQQTRIDRSTIIISCMIGVSALAFLTVLIIDKLFFGRMAELGASCYFDTKQCVAAYMVVMGSVNLIVFLLIIFYVGNCWDIGIIQLGLYVLTAFLLSNIVAMGILSTKVGRENPFYLLSSGVFLALGYTVFSAVPAAFYVTTLGVWAMACFVLGCLLALLIKKLFIQMEKGEVLCMS
ncbi:putative uncharacterized protein [Blautia hydrogenotrophica CAG:147]|mgnify:FL=1|uniref:hypothetical protein n=1 Tax=Blautia hydrogenotrophica TaxID=53443 RepID=UPI00033F8277|nr:hypothetical protein [Blautia hydrogenotrophica]CCX58394.1 putative uncharacterized protein [Blautia hydrogenotrophica CAG:147]